MRPGAQDIVVLGPAMRPFTSPAHRHGPAAVLAAFRMHSRAVQRKPKPFICNDVVRIQADC